MKKTSAKKSATDFRTRVFEMERGSVSRSNVPSNNA
jgi:hypothetical protein